MRLAIMQPYLFPYIGYYQLASCVDKFVFLDDVNFIKKGWINRNRILHSGEALPFTVACHKISQNKKICDIHLIEKSKYELLTKIKYCYKKAPEFESRVSVLETLFSRPHERISEFAADSIKTILGSLNVDTQYVFSSSAGYDNEYLTGQARILDIVRQEKATVYVNLPGGRELYNKSKFADEGVSLNFIETHPVIYQQYLGEFLPNLSFIDNFMFNNNNVLVEQLSSFSLV